MNPRKLIQTFPNSCQLLTNPLSVQRPLCWNKLFHLHHLRNYLDNTALREVGLNVFIMMVREKVSNKRWTDGLVRGSSYSEIMTQNIRRKEPDSSST